MNRERPTRVVVTNVFGDSNRGDVALFCEVLMSIQSAFPDAEIHAIARESDELSRLAVLTIGRHVSFHRQISNVSGRKGYSKLVEYLKRHFWIFAAAVLGAWIIPDHREDERVLAKTLKKCHLAVSCAGGFLEDSNRSYFTNLLQMQIVHAYRIPLVLAPQSIGPIGSPVGRLFVASILCGAKAVFVREAYSYRFVRSRLSRQWWKPIEVQLSVDLALLSRAVDRLMANRSDPGSEQDKTLPTTKTVGLTVVNWSFPSARDADSARVNYLTQMAGFAKELIRMGYRVRLIVQVDADLDVTMSVSREVGIVSKEQMVLPLPETISSISECDYFFGSRFHSCVFALTLGIPFFAISYLPKTKGIMDTLGLDDLSVPIERTDSSLLMSKFGRLVHDEAVIRDRLEGALAIAKELNEFDIFLASYA